MVERFIFQMAAEDVAMKSTEDDVARIFERSCVAVHHDDGSKTKQYTYPTYFDPAHMIKFASLVAAGVYETEQGKGESLFAKTFSFSTRAPLADARLLNLIHLFADKKANYGYIEKKDLYHEQRNCVSCSREEFIADDGTRVPNVDSAYPICAHVCRKKSVTPSSSYNPNVHIIRHDPEMKCFEIEAGYCWRRAYHSGDPGVSFRLFTELLDLLDNPRTLFCGIHVHLTFVVDMIQLCGFTPIVTELLKRERKLHLLYGEWFHYLKQLTHVEHSHQPFMSQCLLALGCLTAFPHRAYGFTWLEEIASFEILRRGHEFAHRKFDEECYIPDIRIPLYWVEKKQMRPEMALTYLLQFRRAWMNQVLVPHPKTNHRGEVLAGFMISTMKPPFLTTDAAHDQFDRPDKLENLSSNQKYWLGWVPLTKSTEKWVCMNPTDRLLFVLEYLVPMISMEGAKKDDIDLFCTIYYETLLMELVCYRHFTNAKVLCSQLDGRTLEFVRKNKVDRSYFFSCLLLNQMLRGKRAEDFSDADFEHVIMWLIKNDVFSIGRIVRELDALLRIPSLSAHELLLFYRAICILLQKYSDKC